MRNPLRCQEKSIVSLLKGVQLLAIAFAEGVHAALSSAAVPATTLIVGCVRTEIGRWLCRFPGHRQPAPRIPASAVALNGLARKEKKMAGQRSAAGGLKGGGRVGG